MVCKNGEIQEKNSYLDELYLMTWNIEWIKRNPQFNHSKKKSFQLILMLLCFKEALLIFNRTCSRLLSLLLQIFSIKYVGLNLIWSSAILMILYLIMTEILIVPKNLYSFILRLLVTYINKISTSDNFRNNALFRKTPFHDRSARHYTPVSSPSHWEEHSIWIYFPPPS